jgi:hypothetical protein
MTIKKRIEGFVNMGNYLKEFVSGEPGTSSCSTVKEIAYSFLENAVLEAEMENPWFTRSNILLALTNIGVSLERNAIERFAKQYEEKLNCLQSVKTVAVIIAGNIPLVGFHDFFCILMAGHKFLGKLSAEDSKLFPAIAEILIRTDEQFREMIRFTSMKIESFDAVIATGSNNTNRYFEYYFGKFPHILRKNRNSVAVITGKESMKELSALADDIFSYFGKGCRSVSKLFLPKGFLIESLIGPFSGYNHLIRHNKYANNYNYYKTVFIIDKKPFVDMGYWLLAEDESFDTPVSVVNYEYYEELPALLKILNEFTGQIQCIICHDRNIPGALSPGTAQNPELFDFADRVDTMDFLLGF